MCFLDRRREEAGCRLRPGRSLEPAPRACEPVKVNGGGEKRQRKSRNAARRSASHGKPARPPRHLKTAPPEEVDGQLFLKIRYVLPLHHQNVSLRPHSIHEYGTRQRPPALSDPLNFRNSVACRAFRAVLTTRKKIVAPPRKAQSRSIRLKNDTSNSMPHGVLGTATEGCSSLARALKSTHIPKLRATFASF